MKSHQTYIFIVLGLFLGSCTPDSLFISVEPSEPKTAVASLVAEDLIAVSLTKSFSALSAEDVNDITEDFANSLLLDSAQVTISYDGITDTLQPFINGLYFTELTSPENYQVLELTVFDSTTSETSTATSVLLPGVELDSVSLTRRDTAETFLSDLDYTFPDPEGENFFVIHVYQFTPPETDSADADSGNTGLFFEDDNFLVYEQIFTDRSAEEGIIRRDAVFEFSSPVDSALVVLTHIEEGYYNFLEARSRSGSLAASLANEPVNHPTNVQNGVGYFSAHQPRGQIIIVGNEE